MYENAFENIVSKKVAILSRGDEINTPVPTGLHKAIN